MFERGRMNKKEDKKQGINDKSAADQKEDAYIAEKVRKFKEEGKVINEQIDYFLEQRYGHNGSSRIKGKKLPTYHKGRGKGDLDEKDNPVMSLEQMIDLEARAEDLEYMDPNR